MYFNTRKGGMPAPVGWPITFTETDIELAAAAAAHQQGLSRLTQRVLDELKRVLPHDRFRRLSRPTVRYQHVMPGHRLDGPRGWHIDFVHMRPRTFYLYTSHAPPTLFLLDSNLETTVDPDHDQAAFHTEVSALIDAGARTWEAPTGRILCYDNREAHRSQMPQQEGWRFFFRAWVED